MDKNSRRRERTLEEDDRLTVNLRVLEVSICMFSTCPREIRRRSRTLGGGDMCAGALTYRHTDRQLYTTMPTISSKSLIHAIHVST